MSFRPIDVMKSSEVSQYKPFETKIQHEQVQSGNSFQSMVKADNKRTVELQKGENQEYRYDAKEKGRGSGTYSGSKGKKKEQNKKQNQGPPRRPGGFDVSI